MKKITTVCALAMALAVGCTGKTEMPNEVDYVSNDTMAIGDQKFHVFYDDKNEMVAIKSFPNSSGEITTCFYVPGEENKRLCGNGYMVEMDKTTQEALKNELKAENIARYRLDTEWFRHRNKQQNTESESTPKKSDYIEIAPGYFTTKEDLEKIHIKK